MPLLRIQAFLRLAPLVGAATLAACAATSPSADAPTADAPTERRVAALLPVDALLLGEQHDAPEHQVIERETVEALAAGAGWPRWRSRWRRKAMPPATCRPTRPRSRSGPP
ncbi:hypothetical protein ACQ858_19990 [Variovorax ureilyticus]|uniref:hypothetical protein n=1 Tax=Variovorax ureilyticus TaxID=1836198 RepID=UPI003D674281